MSTRRVALLGLLLGCGTSQSNPSSEGGEGLTGVVVEEDDDGDGDGSGDDAGQVKFDTPAGGEGTDPDSGVGCQKIDFLFVIDNSGSMLDEQQNLVGSFPGFVNAIASTSMAQDYHVMVVDSDAAGLADVCSQICEVAPDLGCNGIPCDEIGDPQACDGVLGAGKTRDANGEDCQLEGGARYIDGTADELSTTFGCIALVGTNGDGNEQQVDALLSATAPELNEPAACNDGFLRPDAILVVTLITDEEDGPAGPDADAETPSPSDPPDWRAQLLERKGGNEQAIVMLGLVGDTDLPDGLCSPIDADLGSGAEGSPRLRAFVESFENSVLGSVCEPDYSPFFESAVSVIDAACDGFVPPG